MIVLQIEHPVPNFDGWKKAFDNDPAGRKQAGVKRYKIFRQKDNSNYVIVELEFENVQEAESLLAALQKLWNKVEGTIITSPKARIIELFESKEC